MSLKCFKVLCIDNEGRTYDVGVMTTDIDAAKNCAENSLFEGKGIKATAVKAYESDKI